MQYPCDGECQVFLYARAALIDSARRDTSRPCAFEGGALTGGFANCRTDINRQRTAKRESDAQACGTVLVTRCDQQNFSNVFGTETTNASRRARSNKAARQAVGYARAVVFDLARRDALVVCSSWRQGRGVEMCAAISPTPPNFAHRNNKIGSQNGDQKWFPKL